MMRHADSSKTVTRSYSTTVLGAKYSGDLQFRPFESYRLSASILGKTSGWITLLTLQLCTHDQVCFG